VSPEENVVVATHAGIPFDIVRILPFVPAERRDQTFVPEP